jgi:hypothetical protein
LARNVAQDAHASKLTDFFSYMLGRSEDGPYILNVLVQIQSDSFPAPPRPNELEPVLEIARIIQRRFDESVDNPNHFEKIQWFARYWNRSLQIDPGWRVCRIVGPGL